MKLEQIQEAIKASLNSYGEGCADEDNLPEELALVEEGNWEQDYKWQHKTDVYKDDDSNFFMIHNSRNGSPFSDWNYGEPTVQQVVKTEKIITINEWKAI